MPDFNKGDFTQQGVAGHVNANLRLNEKRLVYIDMTSNEEDEGCTITGTVTDLLNNKVYDIGSGGGGGGGSLEPVTLLDITATSEEDGDGNYIIPLYDENNDPLYPGLFIAYNIPGLTFIYDNTEYNCESIEFSFGAPYDNDYDFSVYPFNYNTGSYKFICNDNAPTSHTIQIIMKPSIEKITITNSMASDIPITQGDGIGNSVVPYIFVTGNNTNQYDVLLYSGYGQLYYSSMNGITLIFSDLVNCHLNSYGTSLVITPNCSCTISSE